MDLNNGIIQGDSLSPRLFNVLILVNGTKHMKGCQMGRHNINADDVVLMADSEDSLQRLVYRLNKLGKELNVAISIGKTKCITNHSVPLDPSLL